MQPRTALDTLSNELLLLPNGVLIPYMGVTSSHVVIFLRYNNLKLHVHVEFQTKNLVCKDCQYTLVAMT